MASDNNDKFGHKPKRIAYIYRGKTYYRDENTSEEKSEEEKSDYNAEALKRPVKLFEEYSFQGVPRDVMVALKQLRTCWSMTNGKTRKFICESAHQRFFSALNNYRSPKAKAPLSKKDFPVGLLISKGMSTSIIFEHNNREDISSSEQNIENLRYVGIVGTLNQMQDFVNEIVRDPFELTYDETKLVCGNMSYTNNSVSFYWIEDERALDTKDEILNRLEYAIILCNLSRRDSSNVNRALNVILNLPEVNICFLMYTSASTPIQSKTISYRGQSSDNIKMDSDFEYLEEYINENGIKASTFSRACIVKALDYFS